ncbi:MAG: FG-GAP repeat protein [Candidatus Eisenbacteria bacterium]|nr:FG-GAP repeat protein [Candidatus Eisenbacteria bacterium]
MSFILKLPNAMQTARLQQAARLAVIVTSVLSFVPHSAKATLTGSWATEGNQAGAEYGFSVSTAGDLNGDGYSDVVVGATGHDATFVDEGRVSVYYGGPSGMSALFTIDSGMPGIRFGFSVSAAGDVNGDGIGDLIIGTPYYDIGDTYRGAAFLYFGGAAGVSATADQMLTLPAQGGVGTGYGVSVASAGDVNGDGYDDVIVGASLEFVPMSRNGAAYLYYGGPSGVSANPDWTQLDPWADGNFGTSVAGLGDVNGDGYDDVAVGAENHGFVFVYHGSATGPANSASTTVANGQDGFGRCVAPAGDVNGDGYADLLVGSPFQNSGEGRAFLYRGSASGVSTTADWSDDPLGLFAQYGYCVGTAGDVNGDGYSDFLVGARWVSAPDDREGRAYLYLGGQFGPNADPDWVAEGELPLAELGYSLGSAGDVDGDGYGDVIVGGPFASDPENGEGRVAIWNGGIDRPYAISWVGEKDQEFAKYGSAVALGDFDGDGFDDLVTATPYWDAGSAVDAGGVWVYYGPETGVFTTEDWSAFGIQSGQRFGIAVAALDANHDGYDDLVVGAPGTGSDTGRVHIYDGSASGLPASPSRVLAGDGEGEEFGFDVANAGDVNADGFADLLIGAPLATDARPAQGRANLHLGTVDGTSADPVWRTYGTSEDANCGYSVSGAGDIDADGYADVIVGSPGFDGGTGQVHVFTGSATGDMTEVWSQFGEQSGMRFGHDVSFGGDVDGDGFSDVMIGAPLFDGNAVDGGSARVYRSTGTSIEMTALAAINSGGLGAQAGACIVGADINHDGLSDLVFGRPYISNGITEEGQIIVWHAPFTGGVIGWDGGSPLAWFGSAVACGDVDADGTVDLLIGAPGAEHPNVHEGFSFLLLNNIDRAYERNAVRLPQQKQPDGLTRIAPTLSADAADVVLEGLARSAAGRDVVRLEVEVKRFGEEFDGVGTLLSPWVDTGAPGALGSALEQELAFSLEAGERYRWRMRTLSNHPTQPRSPWITLRANALTEFDFRTGGDISGLEDGWVDPVGGPGRLVPDESGLALRAEPTVFVNSTTIRFALAEEGDARLEIFDATGRRVALLLEAELDAGEHRIDWDGSIGVGNAAPAPAGTYFAAVEMNGVRRSTRIVRLK